MFPHVGVNVLLCLIMSSTVESSQYKQQGYQGIKVTLSLTTMRNPATSTPLTMELGGGRGNLDALRVRATSCASSPMNASDCSTRSAQFVREARRAPRRACGIGATGLRFWICWRGHRFGPRRLVCELGVQDPLSIKYYVYIEYRGGRAAPSMPVTLYTVTYDHARGA